MSAPLEVAYRAQRNRVTRLVTAAASHALTQFSSERAAAIASVIPVVEAGQRHTVALVDAYMAAKTLDAIGAGTVVGLNPAKYTITALRNGAAAADVYGRVFNGFQPGKDPQQALSEAHATLDKLARTDLQLAQTHSARDWMNEQAKTATDEARIVGWRRVTDGDPCALCAAAATRTYRTADLMPIHEHCECGVEPLWGEHAVASVGTTVRVEIDPEIGPRLMADTWSPVGPRINPNEDDRTPLESIPLGSLDVGTLV
jgi:hypothetical protein